MPADAGDYYDSGSKSKTLSPYTCNIKLNAFMEADGWKSPNTYAREYEAAGRFPAVYAFMVVDIEAFYLKSFIAYVGQSVNLAQRWSGHPILAELNAPNIFVKCWFKRTPRKLLRDVEREYIQRFDPPWNLQGRKRGVSLA